jgi:expansin (peptidoglycan-binding protein)
MRGDEVGARERVAMRTRSRPRFVVVGLLVIGLGAIHLGCGASGPTKDTTPQVTSVGETHAGDYSLGPVAFSGSFWNSCAPYTPDLERQAGEMLAGLALKWNGDGSLCDTCILVKTAKGKSVVARVVTTGETQGPNDVDLSQAAFNAISVGEYPRKMTWELVKCPPGGKVQYQFQTEANPDWTSLWVRNARLPLKSVEVKSKSHGSFTPLKRGGDGTLTDAAGFGEGPFTLRVTAADGQIITDTLSKIVPGGVVASSGQFE